MILSQRAAVGVNTPCLHLQGPTEEINGAVYVYKMGGLVPYSRGAGEDALVGRDRRCEDQIAALVSYDGSVYKTVRIVYSLLKRCTLFWGFV